MLRLKYLSASLLFTVITLAAWSQTKEIHILAVNDMHATIDRFPQFVALVDSMRGVYPDLLLFSAGDNRTGNPASDIFKDAAPMVTLMNRAGFHLSAVGNHEFDGDVDGLRSAINNSNFKYVCANMYVHDSLRLNVIPYRNFDVDGARITVLGLLQTGLNGLPDVHPDNVKNVRFRQWEKVAEEYSWLRDRCDVFVLLVHEEYPECVEFLQQYPYADVLIGAHTHMPIRETELHNGVMITQADSHLKFVSHITIQLTDGKVAKKENRLLDVSAFSRKETRRAHV
jgi:2',3'-cyclic-nucleotide 2'-phosphodiesterase (5'-nucleotidase family)